MFGFVGIIEAADSSFNHAVGNQINTDTSFPPDMAGPIDQQFHASSHQITTSSTAAKPMFEHIGRLHVERSSFNYSDGMQYNYNYDHPFSLPNPTPLVIPQTTTAPAAADGTERLPNSLSRRASDATPPHGTTTFGRIDVPDAKSVVSFGSQVNIRAMSSRAVPGIRRPLNQTVQFHAIFTQAVNLTQAIRFGVKSSPAKEYGFARLAKVACELVNWCDPEQVAEESTPVVVDKLTDLVSKLRPIEEFVNTLQYKADDGEITENRERFRAALVEFEGPPLEHS